MHGKRIKCELPRDIGKKLPSSATMQSLRQSVAIALTVVLALGHRSSGGVIGLEEDEAYHVQNQAALENAAHDQHQLSLASSYVQFHGPVEGPEYEVKVPQHHDDGNHLAGQEHEDTVDYVAHPRYEFSYGVEDHHTGDFHKQKEVRDGSSVTGEYSVKEPDGSVRVVRYRADKDGFHAVVHTSGQNDHTAATATAYAGQGQEQVHDHQLAEQQGQDVHGYVASYIDHGY